VRIESGVLPKMMSAPFAECENELGVVALALGARNLDAGRLSEQGFVKPHSDEIEQHACDHRACDRTHRRAEPKPGAHIKRTVHAEHQELALGEVDDPHEAKDQPEAYAHQAVNRADQKTCNDCLQQVLEKDNGTHRQRPPVCALDCSSGFIGRPP
jgi:hypothetical protein